MGLTTLHCAAQNCHLDVVKYLISKGAEVNKGDYKDVTALHIAAQNGHLDVVRYFISKGAEVKKGNENGWTALHIAAQNGHLDVAKYLISKGTERGHLDVTKYLISRGAMEHRAYHDNRTLQKAFAKDEDLDVTKYTALEGVEISDGAFKREISRKKSPFDIVSKLYGEDRSGKLSMYHAKDEVAKETILSRMKSLEEEHYYQGVRDIGLRPFSIDTDELDVGTGIASADFQIEGT
nr:ankyrin-3-like [Lytechinus pictus]